MKSSARGSPEAETTIINPVADADENDSLVQCLAVYRHQLVRAAERLLRRLHVDEADLDAEGAVSIAFAELRLPRAQSGPSIPEINPEFLKVASGAVRRVILRQKRRSRSVKRGGPGRSRSGRDRGQEGNGTTELAECREYRRIDIDLDQLHSREAPVEAVVDARLAFEALIDSLPDDLHRAILVMQAEGFTVIEIASELQIDRKTVARKIVTIKRLCRTSEGSR